MKLKVVVLGAGFGGLELTTILSETIGENLDLTLIDKSDTFFFGYSKLDVMFGRKAPEEVLMPYSKIMKPGVRFRQELITSIDPSNRRVTTDRGIYEADVLVVALGADYDPEATPGLVDGGNEYYSFTGAERLREVLHTFTKGSAIVGVTSSPFKCPPAPSEAALLLHDYLANRGVREACKITLVMPFGVPIPPAPASSKALLRAFAERGITFVPNRTVQTLEPDRHVVILDNQIELPYDLFLGIPKHRVPEVVVASGMAENGWIPVNRNNLATRYPGVYAIGDVTSVGTAKAGVFAEGAARVVAASLIASLQKGEPPLPYAGAGTCYVEFGGGRIGQIDVNFLSGPSPTGSFVEASTDLVRDKQIFGASRRARWFGL